MNTSKKSKFITVALSTFFMMGCDTTIFIEPEEKEIDEQILDEQAPSIPKNILGEAISSSVVNISWNASNDNVEVFGYRLFRNNIEVGITSNLNYSDSGLLAESDYNYAVSAFDESNNESALSTILSVSTKSEQTPDPDFSQL